MIPVALAAAIFFVGMLFDRWLIAHSQSRATRDRRSVQKYTQLRTPKDRTRQLEKRCGVFNPARTDDLQQGAEDWIGRRVEWQASWIIEDGPYAGEWAWSVVGAERPPFVWVPACDIDFEGLRHWPPGYGSDEQWNQMAAQDGQRRG